MSNSHEDHLKAHKEFLDRVYGKGNMTSPGIILTKDWEKDPKFNPSLVYSSILGKYINPTTGEVVETEENK